MLLTCDKSPLELFTIFQAYVALFAAYNLAKYHLMRLAPRIASPQLSIFLCQLAACSTRPVPRAKDVLIWIPQHFAQYSLAIKGTWLSDLSCKLHVFAPLKQQLGKLEQHLALD
jgi:hypothetical protein